MRATEPPFVLDRDRLRASVLIEHLRAARDLTFCRRSKTISIIFRSEVAADWCWQALVEDREHKEPGQ